MNIYYIHFSGDPEKEKEITIKDYEVIHHNSIRLDAYDVLYRYGYCLAEECSEYNTKFYVDKHFNIKILDKDSDIKEHYLFILNVLSTELRNNKINKILVDGNVN